MNCFGARELFFVNFDFKNGCKKEFQANYEKSCSCFKKKGSLKKSILKPLGLTSPTRTDDVIKVKINEKSRTQNDGLIL